jgi:glutamate synthase (ferredoxin)
MVDVERVEDPARARAARLIEKHVKATGSNTRTFWLPGPPSCRNSCAYSKDYKRALAFKRAHDQGLSGDEAIMAALEENARDLSRVGGN